MHTVFSEHAAYANLIERRADLILVARAPSADEIELANRRNVGFDVAAVALDAFILLLNIDNPITELNVDQIRAGWRDRP